MVYDPRAPEIESEGRLYVHRGTGHYGFPLRLGVPAEQSLVNVYVGGVVTAS